MTTHTWKEIQRHNSTDDCWIVYDGDVLDITSWIKRHPGGCTISTLAGEEATKTIQSAHLGDISKFTKQFKIGDVTNYRPTFTSEDAFLATLKKRVKSHLDSENIRLSSHTHRYAKPLLTALLLLSCWLAMYLYPPLGIIAAIPMGMATCSLIGSFGHERIHGNLFPEISSRGAAIGRIINGVLWGILIPFMPERYFQYEHLKHHEHPMNADSDYDVYALRYFLRLTPDIKWRKHHACQHLYAPVIYSMYIFIQVIAGYISPFFDQREILKDDKGLIDVVLMKLTALIFHIIIPVYLTDGMWVMLCAGLYFATWQVCIYVSSGVPHMTLTANFDNINEPWSHYICRTTCNLKCGNKFYDWLCGGLNYHLEHHLLPSIPRSLMPRISPIVKATCEDFNYPFVSYDSLINYYCDHYKFLATLGAPQETPASMHATSD